jgi:CRP/FNR family transcriptional regulator, cyclic AMP receptor protein
VNPDDLRTHHYADQVALAESGDRRSFLGMLDPADREFLLSLGERRTFFRAGARPIVQGDHSDTVFLVVSGLLKVTVDTPDGHEMVVSLLGPGDLVGEFEVIEGASVRSAGNVAVQDLDCLVIAGERFMTALASRPGLALAVMRVLIGRLSAADRRREASASMDVGHSLASYLIELADRYGMARESGIDVAFPLTQEDLASLISCSRDSAVRGLGTLRSRGLIRTMRRRIVVTDLDGLRRFASGSGPARSL